jgi:hypothetical protein
MDNTEGLVVRVKHASQCKSSGETSVEEIGIDLNQLGCEKPERDQRMLIIKSEAESFSLFCAQLDQVTCLWLAACFQKFVAEYPGMSAENAMFFLLSQNEDMSVWAWLHCRQSIKKRRE